MKKKQYSFIILAILFIMLFLTVCSYAITENGCLEGPGDSDTFKVNAGQLDSLAVRIDYDREVSDFSVRVFGMDGKTLFSDMDLDNSGSFFLTGGGVFYIEIYSKDGSGEWMAEYSLKDHSENSIKETSDISLKEALKNRSAHKVEGETVKIAGIIKNTQTFDMYYVLSYSRNFYLEVENTNGLDVLQCDVYYIDGTLKSTHEISTNKKIYPGFLGGMILKLYSDTADTSYEIKYTQKKEMLVDISIATLIENKSERIPASKIELYVPILQDYDNYQEIRTSDINFEYDSIVTGNSGCSYYHVVLEDFKPKESTLIETNYEILLKSDYFWPEDCEGELITEFLESEPCVESNNKYIRNLAEKITEGDTNECEKIISLFDYVTSTFFFEYCDATSALTALKTHKGDCNEYALAIIALARSLGLPARQANSYVLFGPEDLESHAFAEVYIPSKGWTIVDGAMGCLMIKPPIYVYSDHEEDPGKKTLMEKPSIGDWDRTYYYNGNVSPQIEFTMILNGVPKKW